MAGTGDTLPFREGAGTSVGHRGAPYGGRLVERKGNSLWIPVDIAVDFPDFVHSPGDERGPVPWPRTGPLTADWSPGRGLVPPAAGEAAGGTRGE